PVFHRFDRRTLQPSRVSKAMRSGDPALNAWGYNQRSMHRITLSLFTLAAACAQTRGVQSADLLKLRSVGDLQWSPDGSRVAYSVSNNDWTRRPYSQLWIMTIADGKSIRFSADKESSSGPEWSPDGRWIAYQGKSDEKSGLMIAHPDGSGAKFLAALEWTNSPLPTTGRKLAWS